MATAAQTANGRIQTVTFGPVSRSYFTKASASRVSGPFGEIGRTGLRHWGGYVLDEWLRDLQGGRRSAEVFREMVDSDAVAGAIVQLIEMLCRRVTWWVEPAGTSARDEEAAEFYEQCLLEDMSYSWTDVLTEILSFLPNGWAYFEIVWKRRGGDVRDPRRRSKYDDGRIGLRKLAIRSQDTLDRWEFDDEGGIQGLWQEDVVDPISIEKALLFRTKPAKGNPEGRSILRSAYRPWYFKKNMENLEAIGAERDLAGLPLLTAPAGVDIWNSNDPNMATYRREAEKLVSSIRRDEQEGVLLPPGWTLELLSTGGRRQFDTNQIIQRYSTQMALVALADVVLMGHEKVGSYALSQTKEGLFTASLESYLDHVADVFNDHLAPRLFRLNPFPGITGIPKLKHGQVEIIDLETLANFLDKLAGAGAPLFPNQKLLEAVLDAAGLPAPEEEELEMALKEKEPPKELQPAPGDPDAEPDDDLDVDDE